MTEKEEQLPLFISSTNTLFETVKPARQERNVPAPAAPGVMPDSAMRDLQSFIARMEKKVESLESSNDAFLKALETEVGKTQTSGRKVIREFKDEMVAALDTVYRVSAEAQRVVEKREKRRSRIDMLVFFTSAVVFTQAIAIGVYFILGRL